MNHKLHYILIASSAGPHYVGPFDSQADAARYGVGSEDIRWHVFMLTPDEARAPLSVLSPTHAAAIQRQERAIEAERVRERVA
jgi:hypothetical protein